jgi:hypothetical protein
VELISIKSGPSLENATGLTCKSFARIPPASSGPEVQLATLHEVMYAEAEIARTLTAPPLIALSFEKFDAETVTRPMFSQENAPPVEPVHSHWSKDLRVHVSDTVGFSV